ncbi:HotDog domain-containing protein [Aspergillus crustosus]
MNTSASYRPSPQHQTYLRPSKGCDVTTMIGLRQLAQSRLRHAVSRVRPYSQAVHNGFKDASNRAPKRKIWVRRLIYFGLSGCLGLGIGEIVHSYLLKEPTRPGTEEDGCEMREISPKFERVPIVQKLRRDPDWTEVYVYGNYSDEDKERRMTSGPLGGSGGLAIQKVFWNSKEKKAINVVYFGRGTEGWPFIVHGGAIATVLDEHLARVAVQNLPERTAVTANLDVTYKLPAFSSQFYSIHATLDQERSTDRKAYVNGEVRNIEGYLCSTATGLFVVPRGYKLRKLGEGY